MQFKGLGVAMVTPFDRENAVDFPALEKLTNHLIQGGVNYLVVQGTTGESVTLSAKEKLATLEFIKEVNKGRVPLVLGVGGNNTESLYSSLTETHLAGVDAVLSVSPYYSKPTQEGIFQHYVHLADKSAKPIILYNVPGRTASNMLPDTVCRLAEHQNIIGIKEAAGNMEQAMTLIKNTPEDFLVISGDDALTMPFIAAGGDGVISVVGNAYPKLFGKMVWAALNDKLDEAREIHYQLFDLINALFLEGNPGGIKEVLAMLSICENHLRLPLVNVSEKTKKQLYGLVASI
ncbi:MAG: 4-hydroxy-tetrahydrodipicolinate synthase [Luteibaculaceae bacterium]